LIFIEFDNESILELFIIKLNYYQIFKIFCSEIATYYARL